MATEGSLTVVLAHEYLLFRVALAAAFEQQGDIQVVGDAGDGRTAAALATELRPSVALIDVALPGARRHRHLRGHQSRRRCTRVILLSDRADDAALLRGLEAGADGFLTRDLTLAEMIEATRTVNSGNVCIPPAMLGPLLRDSLTVVARTTALSSATPGSAAVSGRFWPCWPTGRTARHRDAVRISPETARTHVQNILAKLEVHSQLEAAALTVAHDLADRFRRHGEAVSRPADTLARRPRKRPNVSLAEVEGQYQLHAGDEVVALTQPPWRCGSCATARHQSPRWSTPFCRSSTPGRNAYATTSCTHWTRWLVSS